MRPCRISHDARIRRQPGDLGVRNCGLNYAGGTVSEEFIDLGAIGASGGCFEVRLDLGGGVLLQLVRS